ncbi:MAG: ribonuclease III domain-containing protein [Anaeromassilibacillus sp.]
MCSNFSYGKSWFARAIARLTSCISARWSRSAAAQAAAAKKLLPMLTEEEAAVYNRGRNAHVGHVPKNAKVADYHAATAFEALFGYVYLTGNLQRLRELFQLACEALDEEDGQHLMEK